MSEMNEIIDALSLSTKVDPSEKDNLTKVLGLTQEYAIQRSVIVSDDRMLAIASHLLAFVRRVRDSEYLPDIDPVVFAEIDPKLIEDCKRLLECYCIEKSYSVSEAEAFLLSVHLAMAEQT